MEFYKYHWIETISAQIKEFGKSLFIIGFLIIGSLWVIFLLYLVFCLICKIIS